MPTASTIPSGNSTTTPGTSVSPTMTTSPGQSQKPGESTKPAESQKPGESANPTESQKPGESSNPAESQNPNESSNPAESQKPGESANPEATPGASSSAAPTASATASGSPAPTASASAKPTASATASASATATPKPSASATATPKPSATATPKPSATATPKPSATATTAPTATPTPSSSSGTQGGSVDLGTKTVFQIGTKKLALGISKADVLTVIGTATRTEASPQGFDVIVYNPDGKYDGYTLIYLQNDIVVGICAIGKTVSYGSMVSTGTSEATLNSAGWASESFYKAEDGGAGAYKRTDSNMSATVFAFVDHYNKKQVYCIQAFSNTVASKMLDPTNCSNTTTVLTALKQETADLLTAYRMFESTNANATNTSYLTLVNDLSKIAQEYLDGCTKGNSAPPLQNMATLTTKITNISYLSDYIAQITMFGYADSIGFANSILEQEDGSSYITKKSSNYKYLRQCVGIGAAVTSNNIYMVINLTDIWDPDS